MGKSRKNFYAVRVGRNTGIYKSWSECEAQVKQYPGARYKGFADLDEAQSFVDGGNNTGGSGYRGRARGGGGGGYSRPSRSNVHQKYSGNFTSRYFSSGNSGSDNTDYSYSLPTVSIQHQDTSSSSTTSQRPVVYSDGCCTNNGYAGARAGIGVYWGPGHPHNVSDRLDGHPTNQRAEVVSACRAIESAISQGFSSVEVKTDSTYTIKAATQWIGKWKKNGWRTSDSGDVKNKSDMIRLDNLCQRMDVKWTHVKGHVGIPGNEAADSLAKSGSRKD